MYKYFNYCDMNDINIYYCNTYSIVIKEAELYKMNNSIDYTAGHLKISGVYNEGWIILSQGKYKFIGSKNKVRNML
jgi:hypothetical protein